MPAHRAENVYQGAAEREGTRAALVAEHAGGHADVTALGQVSEVGDRQVGAAVAVEVGRDGRNGMRSQAQRLRVVQRAVPVAQEDGEGRRGASSRSCSDGRNSVNSQQSTGETSSAGISDRGAGPVDR